MKAYPSIRRVKPNRQILKFLWGCLVPAIFGWIGAAFAAESPQASIKQSATHFFAGETVSRTLLLESLPEATAQGKLAWWLTALNAPLAQGTVDVPANTDRLEAEIEFILPDVQRRTTMHLRASLTHGQEQSDVLDKELLVYPRQCPLSTAAIKGKRFGVIDPHGNLAGILKSLEVEVEELPGVDWVESFDGDGVVVDPSAFPEDECWPVGSDAFDAKDAPSRLMEKLAEAEYDFPVLILTKAPSDAAIADRNQSAEVVAPGHAVFNTLDERDLAGWQPDGLLGVPYGGFPARYPATGGFRSLAALSGEFGMLPGSLLLEQITPRGRQLIRCQLPLVENWDGEPVCQMLMINLLTYMVDSTGRKPLEHCMPVFYGDEQSAWLRKTACILTGLNPRYDEPRIDNTRPLDMVRLVILDANYVSIRRIKDAQPDFFESLEVWVRQGGLVFVFGLDEDCPRMFDWALGEKGQITRYMAPILEKVEPLEPLLWGFGSRDFASCTNNVATLYGFVPDPKSKGWTDLIKPPVMASCEVGEGSIIFCGFYTPTVGFMTREFWIPLLMNQGIMIDIVENK